MAFHAHLLEFWVRFIWTSVMASQDWYPLYDMSCAALHCELPNHHPHFSLMSALSSCLLCSQLTAVLLVSDVCVFFMGCVTHVLALVTSLYTCVCSSLVPLHKEFSCCMLAKWHGSDRCFVTLWTFMCTCAKPVSTVGRMYTYIVAYNIVYLKFYSRWIFVYYTLISKVTTTNYK